MKIVRFLYLINILLALSSCDPMHTLAVYNTSKTERQIDVFGQTRDSIYIQQVDADGKPGRGKPIPVHSNEQANSFHFVLLPGQKANLEAGFGTKPLTRRIIIDGSDTVVVKKSRSVRKKAFYTIGGDYLLTLKD